MTGVHINLPSCYTPPKRISFKIILFLIFYYIASKINHYFHINK